jgi:ketosteroid isomerase-like protein
MLSKASLLQTIDDAYAARARGDKKSLEKYWAAGAQFRLVGAQNISARMPSHTEDPVHAVNTLIDLVRFDHYERLDAIVEGNAAAVHWSVTLSAPGKPAVKTEFYDLWKFNAEGKAISLTQFGDAELLHKLLEQA